GEQTTVGPRFHDLMVLALQSFRLKKADVAERIASALSSAPEAAKAKWVGHVGVPLLNLVQILHSGGDGFETKLRASLVLHKKFWSSKAEWRRHPEGLIAYELSALAGLAHDRGISFEVESDYLPMPVVTGAIFKSVNG